MQQRSSFWIFLILALILPSSSAGAGTVTREIVVDPSGVSRVEGDEGSRLTLRGGFRLAVADGADLPAIPAILLLSPEEEARSVRVEVRESVALSPETAALAAGEDNTPQETPRVLSFRSGRMRGHSVVSAAVSPFFLDPASGIPRLATRMRVVVETRPRPPADGDLVVLRESSEGERTFGAWLGARPHDGSRETRTLKPLVNSGAPFAPGFRPTVDGSPVEMVIITTAEQEAEYQRLADVRTRLGTATVVRTLDWIQANYPRGVDPAETIRNFIKDAVSKWGTAWILIGGDTDEIPVRQAYSTLHFGEDLPTDLYYSDLDRNWNFDGDHLFGEGKTTFAFGDSVDLFPDVWVGRLTSNNAAEAKTVVDKTLGYQLDPPLGYQNDHLFLSEVLFPDNWEPGKGVSFDGPVVSENPINKQQPQQRAVRLYENYTAWPGALPETKTAVLDSLDRGYGLVHHVGHGYINTMSVGLGFQTLANADAEGLTNGNKTFLLYTLNCTSAAIDFNCIAEKFLTNPNGGAVSVIGTTEVEDPIVAAGFNSEFFTNLFEDGITEMGRTLGVTKIAFIPTSDADNGNRWTELSLVYLGDPSLSFWNDVPGTLSVAYDPVFHLGDGTFSVTVERDGSPVDSARVTLFKENDAYAVGFTDVLGSVVLPFTPDETGSLSVGVFVPDALPYLGAAEVHPSMTAYLFPRSQAVTDDGSGSTQGNGDGRMDSGETVELRFSLENTGCQIDSLVQAELVVSDPYVSISDGQSSYPDIAPGNLFPPSDPMILTVSSAVPDRWEAPGTLTVTAAGGTYVHDVVLYLHAPRVELWRQAVRDTVGNGNGDGALAANEDFAIVPRIRNTGLGVLRNAEARLRSSDPAVILSDSTAVFGSLDRGEIGSDPASSFTLRLTDVATEHEIHMVVLDAYGERASFPVDLISPAPPQALSAVGSSSAITLIWDPVDHDDLRGYVVYRSSAPAGPWERVTDWVAEGISYFQDTGLPGLSQQFYLVSAIDSSGNESALSDTARATTTLPLHPGWPVEVTTSVPAGVTLGDLDNDGTLEILGGGDEIYVVTPDAQEYLDGDTDARTLGPLMDTGGVRFWNTMAVGDVNGDGTAEVAAIGWDDGLVYLVDFQGQILPGWPKDADINGISPSLNPVGSPVLADLDADGDLEVLATVGKNILAWHHTGVEYLDGDANPATDGVFAVTGSYFSYGTPTVANIDADPYAELVAGMYDGKLYVFRHDGTLYPGFPFVTGRNITSSPAVGDIDDDGQPEIVFASSDSLVYAIRADLSSAAGFPKYVPMGEDWDSSPALGDVSGDGVLDVAIGGGNGYLYVWSGTDGSALPGFPIKLEDTSGAASPTRSSPVLADVNGDGSVDILIGDNAGTLHGYDASGQPLAGFPIRTANRIQSAPVVWDVDGDGLTEVLVESGDQRMYCWDSPWAWNPALAPWPMFKGNQGNTGSFGDPPLLSILGDRTPNPIPLLLQNAPNPFLGSTTVLFRVPEGPRTRVELTVFDIRGRRVRVLEDGTLDPGLHRMTWDGRDSRGVPVASGIYPYRLRVGDRTMTRKMVLISR